MLSKEEYQDIREKFFSDLKKIYDQYSKIYKLLYEAYPYTISALKALHETWVKRELGHSLEVHANSIRCAINLMEEDLKKSSEENIKKASYAESVGYFV